jgi:hypothetical protein
MDFNYCGFDRVRSRPAMIIKEVKKAAYSPKMQHSPQSSARRLAPPLFLPADSSHHEVLTVAQMNKADAACAEAYAARPDEEFCHAAPHLSVPRLPPPPTSPTYLFLCRDFAQTYGWSGGGKGRDASSALGSNEAGDGGIDKATRAAIARA